MPERDEGRVLVEGLLDRDDLQMARSLIVVVALGSRVVERSAPLLAVEAFHDLTLEQPGNAHAPRRPLLTQKPGEEGGRMSIVTESEEVACHLFGLDRHPRLPERDCVPPPKQVGSAVGVAEPALGHRLEATLRLPDQIVDRFWYLHNLRPGHVPCLSRPFHGTAAALTKRGALVKPPFSLFFLSFRLFDRDREHLHFRLRAVGHVAVHHRDFIGDILTSDDATEDRVVRA